MAAPCATKEALLRAYQDATLACSNAVLGLTTVRSDDDFDSVFRTAEEADQKVIAAREALRKHMAEHGCGGRQFP